MDKRLEADRRYKILEWMGSEVLPHEADLRTWLRRIVAQSEIEDVIQDTYCQLSGLGSVDHIRSGRAYLFTTGRNVVLQRLRRARIISIETITEIDTLMINADEPSPERIAAGRHELARVTQLIDGLPERCRRIFVLRKIEGLSQREVAQVMGVAEHTVENDVAKGLKLILQAMTANEQAIEQVLANVGKDEQTRDSKSDR